MGRDRVVAADHEPGAAPDDLRMKLAGGFQAEIGKSEPDLSIEVARLAENRESEIHVGRDRQPGANEIVGRGKSIEALGRAKQREVLQVLIAIRCPPTE